MSNALYNLAAMTVASTGAGTITLGAAATIQGVKYNTFALAGVPDGALVYYSILDLGASEQCSGTYTASGTTLTRTTLGSTNGGAAINMTAAAIVIINPPSSQLREILTANRTYYVRTDGSDANTGLANSAAGAFLTIQHAYDVISQMLDLGGLTATISVVSGTFTAGLNVTKPVVGGTVTLDGNSVAIISTTSADAVAVHAPLQLTVQNIELRTTTSGVSLLADGSGSVISIGAGMIFGVCAAQQIRALSNGLIQNTGNNYTISGACPGNHIQATVAGVILFSPHTVTITGTPAFGTFMATDLGASASMFGITYSGSATGPRYSATLNSQIQTYGGGANYFPGNSAGSTATGGQYG